MKMKNTNRSKLGALALSAPLFAMTGGSLSAGDLSASPDAAPVAPTAGEKFFRLDPHLHFRAAHGYTDLPNEEGVFGGHDPKEDNFNLQGLEIGASFYAGKYIAGFATVNVFKNDGEDFESEFEEGFVKFHNLPGNFEIRAGRMLARFGDQNAKHLHGWDFVNSNLGNVRFFGEDGFAYEGAELSWLVPTPFDDILSVGFGSALVHDHDEEEEEHDDDDMDDDLDDDHGHNEEAELAALDSSIVTIRYQARFGANDFHRFKIGGSFITGDNGFDKTTNIYGADFTYTWRENGLERGGQQFRWRTEWIMRDVENDEGGFKDNSFNTALLWRFAEGWEAGIRYEWLEGGADPELAERTRISPSITKRIDFGDEFIGHIRLQYDHDDIDEYGTEDSIWLQFGFDWGPGEVR